MLSLPFENTHLYYWCLLLVLFNLWLTSHLPRAWMSQSQLVLKPSFHFRWFHDRASETFFVICNLLPCTSFGYPSHQEPCDINELLSDCQSSYQFSEHNVFFLVAFKMFLSAHPLLLTSFPSYQSGWLGEQNLCKSSYRISLINPTLRDSALFLSSVLSARIEHLEKAMWKDALNSLSSSSGLSARQADSISLNSSLVLYDSCFTLLPGFCAIFLF